jgi:hypothetical protein
MEETGGTYSYRLVVLVKGQQDQKITGPWKTNREEVESDLGAITSAKEGSGLIALSWMTVRESEVSAAYIEELLHMPLPPPGESLMDKIM